MSTAPGPGTQRIALRELSSTDAPRVAALRDRVLAVTMLDPAARGMWLHRRAIERRLAIAREHRRSCAVAIAAPSNVSSLCNLLREGGRLSGLLDLPGGRVRYLICFADDHGPSDAAGEIALVPVAEPERVRALLARGWGTAALVVVDGRPCFRMARRDERGPA